MPEINIEEKIQEALKRKSFKENKFEYIALTIAFSLIIFVTFLAMYFLPFLAPIIFLFIDVPLMMGYKHFIWFGPASGETLFDGFKVSIVCGYLNFVSYFKIFFTTNMKPFLLGSLATILSESFGLGYMMYGPYKETFNGVLDKYETITNEAVEELFNTTNIAGWLIGIQVVSLVVGIAVYLIIKLRRALLPYVSFLRLTNLEGKSMEGTLNHTRKIINLDKKKYYIQSFLYHLLYLIPFGLAILTSFLLSMNPTYSVTTIDLISMLVFFVTCVPGLLGVELFYRHFCIDVNKDINQEKNMMLNDAINDLNKNNNKK